MALKEIWIQLISKRNMAQLKFFQDLLTLNKQIIRQLEFKYSHKF